MSLRSQLALCIFIAIFSFYRSTLLGEDGIQENLVHEFDVFAVSDLALSGDGSQLAIVGSAFEGGRVMVVECERWKSVFDKTYAKVAWSVAWSPNGKTIAVGSTDHEVRLWEISTGKERHIFRGHSKQVRTLAFSPDGKCLATGSDDGTIRLWHPDSGESLRKLEEPKHRIGSVRFSPDGEYLLASSLELIKPQFTLWVWDISSNMRSGVIHRQAAERPPSAITFSPDGKWTSWVEGGNVVINAWPTGEKYGEIATNPLLVGDIVFSPDSTFLAIADVRQIALFGIPSRRTVARFTAHDHSINSLAFLHDGKTLISAGDRKVKIWRVPVRPTRMSD